MSAETREALLHSQLQEGLRYELMEASAVSGAQTHRELCMALKNEEKRLIELRKRRNYGCHQARAYSPGQKQLQARWTSVGRAKDRRESSTAGKGRLPQKLQQPRCYQCGVTGHLARDCCKFQKPLSGNVCCYNCRAMGHLANNCRARKTESSGTQQKNWGDTRQVQTADSSLPEKQSQETAVKPEDFLLSTGLDSDSRRRQPQPQ